MTDRYNALIVILENDLRSDDAESLIRAILQLRGVLRVEANVASGGGVDGLVAEQRVRYEIRQKLMDVLK